MKNLTPIANYELYSISSDGKVHSGKFDIVMKTFVTGSGYESVNVEGTKLLIHRLVALHFIPNPYQAEQVNHIDGNKLNNDVSNLEWVTSAQNHQHALEKGLRKGFIHVDVRRELLGRVLNEGATFEELGLEMNTHPNALCKRLRLQATQDDRKEEWTTEMKKRRKAAAIKNLEKVNAKN